MYTITKERPTMPFPQAELPNMALVRQEIDDTHIEDPRGEVMRRLIGSGMRDKIQPGQRIAITAGSRGVGGFVDLLSGIVDAVKQCGGEPFLVPAMGSHGGAVAEGQAEVLRLLGVTEEAVGAPIYATMDTVTLGVSENGAVVHLDKSAAEADGIIVFGRTKTHPESAEGIASGLLKMITIGLGKQAGAQQAHNHGLWESVCAVPKVAMANAKILCGVAVVENGNRKPLEIEIVPPEYDRFLESDERLLKLAKDHLAKIPFDDLDLLIVDEIGKTVSGSGMDLNVIGHKRATGEAKPGEPNIRRIVALSLTKPSLGNGLGIGLADFTTERFLQSYDPHVSYINLFTATEPDSKNSEGPLPLALSSDREAISVGLYSSLAGHEPRICRIRNTGDLNTMWVSPVLLDEVRAHPKMTVLHRPKPFDFDLSGNLIG